MTHWRTGGRGGAAALAVILAAAARADDGAAATWTSLPPLPDAEGVAGAFAGASGGALLVAGGANFPGAKPWEGGTKAWTDRAWVLDKPDGAWREAGRLPGPRAYGASVATPAGLLCIGGNDTGRHHDAVFLLRWTGATLERDEFPSLPEPRANLCGALAGRRVIVAGGEAAPGATAAGTNCWALDLDDRAAGWRALPSWPGPGRSLAAAGTQGGEFFLFGGVSLAAGPDGAPLRTYLRDAYAWRAGRGWRRIADLPNPLAAAPSPAPPAGQSFLLLAGGDDGSRARLGAVPTHPGFEAPLLGYHTITDTWTPLGALPAVRVTTPAVAWAGGFVIPSGEVRPGVRSPEVRLGRLVPRKAGFGALNYATLGVYLAAMVLMGAAFTRRNRTTNDFFRGGQRVPWWAAGLSIFATMLSSITFMAIPARGYAEGWNLFLANVYLVLTPLVTLVYLPFYRSLDVTSAYEYLERRFNAAARMLASALFLLFQCGRVAIVLYLPALALATVSNLDVTTSIVLMGVLCVVYTMLGGMEAVIWTDVLQSIVLLGGAVWALVTVLVRIDGGAAGAIATAAGHGRFFQSVPWTFDLAIASGWVIMVGGIFQNLFSYTASQDVVQRYLTTADRKSAARAIWTNAAVSPVAQALFFAIGTALFVYYRQHPERLDPTMQNDAVFPLFIVRELPAGIAGLVVAGIFAAAQSTLAGSLNSMATAYVTDFDRRFRPGATDGSRLRLARWLTAVIGFSGTAVALWLAKSDVRSLWEAFLNVIGLFGGTVSGLFVLGLFVRRANGFGAIVGGVASAAVVGWIFANKLAIFWTYAIAGVVVCVGVGWLASLLRPAPKGTDSLTFHALRRSGGADSHSDAEARR
jgi:SSS family transporter